MLCCVCKEKEATVHLTQIAGDKMQKVDLCEEQEDLANLINGSAPGVLAAAAKDVGAKFVHYSTDFVFNGNSTRPWREDDPTNPLSAYGRSKFALEQQHDPSRDLIIRAGLILGNELHGRH